MTIALLKNYALRCRNQLRAGATNVEQALAPEFKLLLEELIPTLVTGAEIQAIAEYAKPGIGRPDIALKKTGQPARAFVELKSPEKPADPDRWKLKHDKRQYANFQSLHLWAACNFSEIRLFQLEDPLLSPATVVPAKALDPDTPDKKADALIDEIDPQPFEQIVTRLATAEPPSAANAEEMAANLAHASRIVRGIIADRLEELADEKSKGAPLQIVREDFRNILFAHPEAAGYRGSSFDEMFSSAFAQTLAFGLLLVREAIDEKVDEHAWEHMPDIHPLMRSTLRVLSQPEIQEEMGSGLDVMIDTVNSFDPELLKPKPGKRDPILYFYEDFLETFDPEARDRYGVYYTPVEVVKYMVGALDRALRENLDTKGLSDDQVTILDPATGTGTFLLGIAERVFADVEKADGKGAAALALKDLATRMFGFELLVGPYAVAHYRLHHKLTRPEGEKDPMVRALDRLGVYLADTLAEPGTTAPDSALGKMLGDQISEERREADRIKTEQPILAIIGNPPYRRLEAGENETLIGRWMDELWDDLKEPVRAEGWGNQLNTFPELSVAFWRWAIWKLFEADNAPEKGIVAFITNRTFLKGKPYAGLRKMMRERFDRIEVIDLRGDVRLGERAGITGDQGVFNIQVGTAIAVAISTGEKAADVLADVLYVDSWSQGQFTQKSKLSWLYETSDVGEMPDMLVVERGMLDDMRPIPFQNGEWISLGKAFDFRSSGIQTKRDSFAYACSEDVLLARLNKFKSFSQEAARQQFHVTAARSASAAQAEEIEENLIMPAAYRPLDVRFLYNKRAFIDRPRPDLQAAWGTGNLCMYTLAAGVGQGASVWCHSVLPDNHAFRGSYGGYAFPLYDRRPGHDSINLSSELLDGLGEAYGAPVEPEAVFDAILALLSATSYTTRFAEDLEDVFPHIPFPADRAVFDNAASIGAEIRAVETFARDPDPKFRTAKLEDEPEGTLDASDWGEGAMTLCADGSGRLSGIPADVWKFEVSGYRVLKRWLDAREGLEVDKALVDQITDITSRIAELIDLFAQADTVLEAALASTLSRDKLFDDETE
ncbi:type ISP restriction/modification enzyme [Parasphingopyxis marina]|uniref:site-specific DNA-methyltransferase (adenine-specific) n=1 Tax=Parasphingopyxis marina TaxID=2761622 RepID=A0A842I0W3_9SPHN|nr:type ISP restriction/modification enzyme [Parasphingopyxis marina]MBC2778351.1 N-6 DNA methylase [Parasphingopyxis marina]